MIQFFVYDVFTDAPFGGNQLAVIPDATGLPEGDLQKITREFNFSETTFVYPPADPAHTARVRIFTPTTEIPFAGHPTIGTAIALHDLGGAADMVLELGVGPIPCKIADGTASFITAVPLQELAQPPAAMVAAALGLPENAIKTDTHAPVQASLGLPFVIVELADAAALNGCAPVIDALRKGAKAYPAGLDFALFAYVRDGSAVDARMFAPLDNIPEDPATGSAAATLTALLTQISGQDQTLRITQGVAMGRPSLIQASSSAADMAITISGTARRTMEGTLVY